jgi:hypothetical protein
MYIYESGIGRWSLTIIGHVNNVMYNRYAESARVNWTRNFAAADPAHAKQWMELITPKSVGLILRSITTDYKFVSLASFFILRFSNKRSLGLEQTSYEQGRKMRLFVVTRVLGTRHKM